MLLCMLGKRSLRLFRTRMWRVPSRKRRVRGEDKENGETTRVEKGGAVKLSAAAGCEFSHPQSVLHQPTSTFGR
jgi:hypothetical protein